MVPIWILLPYFFTLHATVAASSPDATRICQKTAYSPKDQETSLAPRGENILACESTGHLLRREELKRPWFRPNSDSPSGEDATESHLGTEASCANSADLVVRQFPSFLKECSMAEHPPGFCTEECQKANSEVCLGTVSFCRLPDVIALYGSTETCLNFRQSPPFRPWQLGGGCRDPVEKCFGTDVLCSLFFKQRNYISQKHCFLSRQPRPKTISEWKPTNPGGPKHFEDVEGTEATCGRITDLSIRKECFQSRKKAPWQNPNSPGREMCWNGDMIWIQAVVSRSTKESASTITKREDEERCLGTVEWCYRVPSLYRDKFECLERRGLPLRPLIEATTNSTQSRIAANITAGTILRSMLIKNMTREAALEEAQAKLDAFKASLRQNKKITTNNALGLLFKRHLLERTGGIAGTKPDKLLDDSTSLSLDDIHGWRAGGSSLTSESGLGHNIESDDSRFRNYHQKTSSIDYSSGDTNQVAANTDEKENEAANNSPSSAGSATTHGGKQPSVDLGQVGNSVADADEKKKIVAGEDNQSNSGVFRTDD
ncbi:hypothetical protein HRG_012989 [Hirsutella rhossiliensis]